MGFTDGTGFDWNGDGKSDAFDSFMDTKVSGSDSSDGDEAEDTTNLTSAPTYKKSEDREQKNTGISMGGKPLYDATKDSSGVTILKCVLVTALCIGGIALPAATDMGVIGTLICVFCAIGLSVLFLKNT